MKWLPHNFFTQAFEGRTFLYNLAVFVWISVSIGVPVFVLYNNDCSVENVMDFNELLSSYGIKVDADVYHIDENPDDWSLWVEKQLLNCIYNNGLIIVLWSVGLKILLQDGSQNCRIQMSSGHIFRASLRSIMQQYLNHFVLVSFDPVSLEELPPFLRHKTVYIIPITNIPESISPSEIFHHTGFTHLEDLTATVFTHNDTTSLVDLSLTTEVLQPSKKSE